MTRLQRWAVIAHHTRDGRTTQVTTHWTRWGARSFALELQRVADLAGAPTRYTPARTTHTQRTHRHLAALPAFKGPHDSVTD